MKRKIFSKNILIFLFFIFFAGGVGFAGAGKIKPAAGETINLIWNGTGWTATNGSGQTIDVKWLNQIDENFTGPNGTNDIIALCTMNGSITLTLNAPLEISKLFVFGGYPCTINLNEKQLEITDTLYLGSSWDNSNDIDGGIIANNDGRNSEGNKLGYLTVNGTGSVHVNNMDTTTWRYDGDALQNPILNVDQSVTSFVVEYWNLGSINTDTSIGGTKGSVVPDLKGDGAENVTIKDYTTEEGADSLKVDFVFELIKENNTSVEEIDYIWTGLAGDRNWKTAENWTNNNLPENSVTVIIPKCNNNNYPEISELIEDFSGNIQLFDEATLTIKENGELQCKTINFQNENSKITVNGTLNLTKDSPVDYFTIDSHFDSDSTGKIYCSDKVNHLVIETTFSNLNSIEKVGGDITISQNVKCESINAKSIIIKNDTAPTVEFGSITADSIQNGGDLTVNSESQVSSIINQHKLTIADGEYLDVKKQFSNNGIFTGSIKFSGDNITENNILLGDSNSEYKELLIDTTKSIQFEGDSVIENLKVVNAESVKFLSAVTINEIDDNGFTGDFYFDATKFDQNTGGATSEGFNFNTSGVVYIGKDSNSQISFVNATSPVNFTHTAGKTLITGNLSANDVTLSETEISGTVTANNITLEATKIIGDSELKATNGKITLKGNISSTDSKSLTLNGNVEIPTTSTSQLEINLNEGILETKAIKSESSLSIKAKTQTFDGTISVTNDFTSEGETFTFADKVTVNQNAQIQNTGLLKISDFVYGKKFTQKGIGQVMISGSFEQSGESGASEKPPATFGSNVYFYNSSQNLSPITIGSDKSSITIKGNLIIAKSKENDVAIKGTVESKNFALYSGNVDLSGDLSTEKDVVILGENYSLKDDQTGIENLYSYTENRPALWSKASYSFETELPNGTKLPDGTESNRFSGKVNVLSGKSITVKKNLYANGTVFALSGTLGSGKWKLNVPDTSVAANAFCEVYNSEVSDCDAAYQISALQCTDKSGNQNWAFDDVKITKAYSVSDNVIRVEFNKPVRILKDGFTQKQMCFSNEPDEHYFENVYLDEKCTTEASEVVNQYYEENGNKNYFVYFKANSKWNTDATGTSAGAEKSTDYDGVHHNTTICLDFPRAITTTTGVLSYIITDLWGKRLTNYSARTLSGTQKIPFENVEDKTGPVLISVKTGQENHTEYDGTKGAESQPSYDSHNFIEFVYSEPVNFGSENSNGADEVFLKADDQGIEKAKNIQVTQKFGALQNEDITRSGELKFAGLAKIQNGKIYTDSQNNQGNADKYVNALYRFDKYSLRYSIAGYTHPTEFVQDDQGNNHKKWIGYIEEAELPTGTVSMICDGKNDLVFDMAGNSQTLVKNNLTVDSSKSGVYGNWDISKPIFAPLRKNGYEWDNFTPSEYEIIGDNEGFGDTVDRISIHLFDNTPTYSNQDQYAWITERGWCNLSSPDLYTNYSYAADIFGGSRPFQDENYRTSGGIRFSSLDGCWNNFSYSVNDTSFEFGTKIDTSVKSKIFTGNNDIKRIPNKNDGLYFSILFKNGVNYENKTQFNVIYDGKSYITDLAGNRIKDEEREMKSVNRKAPSFTMIITPIGSKKSYLFFVKSITQNSIQISKSDGSKIEPSDINFSEVIKESFEIGSIDENGEWKESEDLKIDLNVPFEFIELKKDRDFTCIAISLNKEVTFEHVNNLFFRVKNPDKYNYTMNDPWSNLPGANVTLIQDGLGNYMEKYEAHALSDFSINHIDLQYAYNDVEETDFMDSMKNLYDENLQTVRTWNENQGNYGTLFVQKPITTVADVTEGKTSVIKDIDYKLKMYYTDHPDENSLSNEYNSKMKGDLRLWLPNLNNKVFSTISLSNNTNFKEKESELVKLNDVPINIKFSLDYSDVEKWGNGSKISFLFSYYDEFDNPFELCLAPVFLGDNKYSLVEKYPLFAIRMENPQDITTLDLWSFRLKNLTEQRGGVSILNNVINATYGEKAVVKVNVPQDSNVDVIVMTLDGNIV
ncbi:MAG: hypothetical protein IKK80_03980, partial [Treponema sp.]|nr:hypothetical protein [Treponema sp.]